MYVRKSLQNSKSFFNHCVHSPSTCRCTKSRNCVWITEKANPSHLIEILVLILWENEAIPCDDQMKKGFCQFGKAHTRVVQPSIAVDFVGGGLFGRHEGAATAYVPTSSNSLQKRTQWIAKIRSGLACCWMTAAPVFGNMKRCTRLIRTFRKRQGFRISKRDSFREVYFSFKLSVYYLHQPFTNINLPKTGFKWRSEEEIGNNLFFCKKVCFGDTFVRFFVKSKSLKST